MCSNYVPVNSADRLMTFFGVEYERDAPAADVFPLGMSPFIRLAVEGQEGGRPALLAEDGMFGLLPTFATEVQYGRKTYNCRSETVHQLASFRPAWGAGQRCVIPVDAVYEPDYETGKAIRWKIFQAGGEPLGVAGVYRRWKNPVGGHLYTFTMLTMNCDAHPFYKRFHKPGDEKRIPIFLRRDEYIPWLTAKVDDASAFFKLFGGQLVGEPAPLARVPKMVGNPPQKDEVVPAKKVVKRAPPPPPDQEELF